MYEYVIRLRVTDFLYKYLTPQHITSSSTLSLVYSSLRMLHYMDFPSAARKLKANFSGVIAFDFSIYLVANTVFGSHETKNLSGPSFMFYW